ncbi:MAG: S8 family serine peptidase [Bacteroidota bacterium]
MRFSKFTLMLNILLLLVVFASPVLSQNVIAPNLEQRLQKVKSGEKIRINIRLSEQYDAGLLAEKTRGIADKEQRRSLVVSELKSFSKESQKDLLAFLDSQQKSMQVSDVTPLWIVNLINCYATPQAIEQLAQMPGIARIDYDMMRQVIELEQPVAQPDKLADKQTIAWNVNLVNAPAAWEEGFTGENVIVAVLDTGVNADHQDLEGRMWMHPEYPNHGYNFVNNNDDTSDGQSHGTHCAGTVAGNGTAGTATGIAPGATIMALKVLGNDGSGTEAGVWAAIQFAVDYGAQVMSLSLGWQHSWNPDRSAWRTAMVNAMNAGLIAAVASGNEGGWGGQAPPAQVRTPGDCPAPWTHPDQTATGGNSAVVTVGSTTNTDAISGFSSKGPVTWQNIEPFNDYAYNPGTGLILPDIVAPGSDILSLSNTSNTGYTVKSGTSMATPAVAGLMALMLSKNPNLTPEQISQILEETALPLSTNKSNTFGSGRIDALAAIQATPFNGIRYVSHTINDSQGNDNGNVNPGETISLSFSFENPMEEAINDVTMVLQSESEFITITLETAELGDFQPGEIREFNDIFTFETSEIIPGNYDISFSLVAVSSETPDLSWSSTFEEPAYAQQLVFLDVFVDDSESGNNNNLLDPGETATLVIGLRNIGQLTSEDISLTLQTDSEWLTLHQTDTMELTALEPEGVAEAQVVVTAFHETPLETLEDIMLTAVSGLYEYEETQVLSIGVAPVYSEGNIPSTFNQNPEPSSNAIAPGVLTVTIPEDAIITGVDVEYDIVSTGGAWISEQRSILRCVTEGGTSEAAITSGTSSNSGGTVEYERQDLTIANDITGGGDITFELHVFRTWGGSGSNTQYAYVPNNTWKVIVQYQLPRYEATFKVSNQLSEYVEDAVVTIGNTEKTTDANGEAVFMLPQGNHFFTVTADRHRPIQLQPFELIEEEEIIQVELTRVFLAAFQIGDVLGNEVENALIYVEDELIEGVELDDLDNGIYPFRIEAEGYAVYEDSFEINNDDIALEIILTPVYNATFSIWDQWGNEVDHAVITIEDQTMEPGEYQIDNLVSGEYNFTISANSFFDYEGNFEIDYDHLEIEAILVADGTLISELEVDALRIYPNPAQRTVTIEFTALENVKYQVSLINHLGQTVHQWQNIQQPGTAKIDMDVTDLNPGIYFIRIDNGSEMMHHKFIVQ